MASEWSVDQKGTVTNRGTGSPEVIVVLEDLPSVSSLPMGMRTVGGTHPASGLADCVLTNHLSSILLSSTSTTSPFLRERGWSPDVE